MVDHLRNERLSTPATVHSPMCETWVLTSVRPTWGSWPWLLGVSWLSPVTPMPPWAWSPQCRASDVANPGKLIGNG